MESIRLAARTLRRSPVFAAAAILILAAGIGVNTVMFTVVSGVLMTPLPFARPDELIGIGETRPDALGEVRVAPGAFTAWREAGVAAALTGYTEAKRRIAANEPVEVAGAAVLSNFFGVLGVQPSLGRAFTAADDANGAAPVVILGHALWQQRFGGDSAVIGRSVQITDATYEVVGIAAPGFDFPNGAQLWVTLWSGLDERYRVTTTHKFMRVIGRLPAGTTVDQVQAQLTTVSSRLPNNQGWSARVRLLKDEFTGDVRRPLLILMAAVGVVLLVACANVGNLMLARSMTRTRDLAVRAALGASRARLVRELLLAESMLLSVGGGLLGILAAMWGLDVVLQLLPAALPWGTDVRIDPAVLGFALLASLLTGLAVGVLPALRSARADLTPALKEGARGTEGRASARARSLLVIGEIALSMMLLVAAGLLLRSFSAAINIDNGFDPERVTTFQLSLQDDKYYKWEAKQQFMRTLVERTEALPGITSAALADALPATGKAETSTMLREGETGVNRPAAYTVGVSPGYFRTMGIRVLDGREFETADDLRPVAIGIVNETFARTFFPGENPIGRKVTPALGGTNLKTIVGVVADIRQNGPLQTPEPMFYTPTGHRLTPGFRLVVRSSSAPEVLIPAVRTLLREMDADLPMGEIATMNDIIGRSVARPRFYAALLGTFATLAALLAVLGLYAVMAQSVAQRKGEIGIRMALGAEARDVRRLVVWEGMRLALLGGAIGVIGALATTRVLSSLLFGLTATDAPTYIAVTALLFGAALLAVLVPAARAARLDPLQAMRR